MKETKYKAMTLKNSIYTVHSIYIDVFHLHPSFNVELKFPQYQIPLSVAWYYLIF